MKLRYSPTSPFVRKVLVVAIETGLDGRIERVPTTVVPVQPNEDLSHQNPLMKVPTLVTDDGQVLFDSRVICEYLDSLHTGSRLIPAANTARWTALRQQALGDGILDAGVLNRYETAVRPKDKQWAEWSVGQMRKIRNGLAALDGAANDGALDGPLTIGPIAIGCALGYLDFRYASEGWRERHPALAKWYAEFAKRKSMLATVPPPA
ncbi:MAG TPA: glutathione S-transferase N-terminal domain-containing protein [Stellaceae bacterium]|nr:glutathione S-transferase N-terminal domain-containing protein [Stellaceae bacterium]